MTTIEKLGQVSKRPWFIAIYRWAVICLVPATMAFASWLVWTVYSTQIVMAEMGQKLSTVIVRVDGLEDANRQAISEKVRLDERRQDQATDIISRLARVEESNALILKQMDRLFRLFDDSDRKMRPR